MFVNVTIPRKNIKQIKNERSEGRKEGQTGIMIDIAGKISIFWHVDDMLSLFKSQLSWVEYQITQSISTPIGSEWSRDLDTGLWLVEHHMNDLFRLCPGFSLKFSLKNISFAKYYSDSDGQA